MYLLDWCESAWSLRISAATVFLWVSCILAILITSGMHLDILAQGMDSEDFMFDSGCSSPVYEASHSLECARMSTSRERLLVGSCVGVTQVLISCGEFAENGLHADKVLAVPPEPHGPLPT